MAESTVTQNTKRGFIFLLLALLAFSGLGLEILLAFLIEPLLYGKSLYEFSTAEYISHWVITCILWAISAFLLLFYAKRRLSLNIFENPKRMKALNWVLCFICLIISVTVSLIDWNGFKPVKEFLYHGWLKFIFQYLYYIVETALVFIMIVFGQEAGEKWFHQTKTPAKVPYGGILTALTWGLIHILTKGDILVGLICFASGVLYGTVYLLSSKNVYIAFPFILFMFIL